MDVLNMFAINLNFISFSARYNNDRRQCKDNYFLGDFAIN